jgi:DNA-binding Lrp family transcriptional regulator
MSGPEKVLPESVWAELEELIFILNELESDGILEKFMIYKSKREMGYENLERGISEEDFKHVVQALGRVCQIMIEHEEVIDTLERNGDSGKIELAIEKVGIVNVAANYREL